MAGAELVGETEGFQLVQAPDLLGVIFVRLHLWIGRHVDDACMATITDELAVELGPALRPDLPLQIAADVDVGSRPEFLCNEIRGAGTHPILDVVASDHEILSIIGLAAQDDVDMRVVGIPVIDGGPIELRAKILLHLAHQLARKGFEVRHIQGVLGRDDEPEMVAVLVGALRKGEAVDLVALPAE